MQQRLCEMSEAKWSITEAKWSITEAKCLQMSHNNKHPSGMRFRYLLKVLVLSHSAGMHNIDTSYYRHFEKIPFRFAPLHLFCIPAYTHQIPNGISSHLLQDNMYIIPK